MSVLEPWIWAAVLMAGMGAWLALALRVVGDSELPTRVHRRARWWRQWGWAVAGACSVTALAASSLLVVW